MLFSTISSLLQNGVVKYFNSVPRFGHSENAYDLVGGDRKDYIYGMILIPILVLATTILWFAVFAVFTYKYRHSHSFISGNHLSRGKGPFIRTIFLIAAGYVLASSIMYFLFGFESLSSAFNDIKASKGVSICNDHALVLRYYCLFADGTLLEIFLGFVHICKWRYRDNHKCRGGGWKYDRYKY